MHRLIDFRSKRISKIFFASIKVASFTTCLSRRTEESLTNKISTAKTYTKFFQVQTLS